MSDLQGPGFVREASRSISGGIRRSDDNLVDGRRYLWRSRWAAIGAAVAVSFGGGGLFVANAASSAPSSVVSIDPVRILDTRDPVNIGLPGPFVSAASQKLQVTGSVVPSGATGVLLNVTVTAPSANGFLSIRPGDATGAASTSSLNFNPGQTVPNSVQVALPTAGANAGQIDITYDAYGVKGPTTDVLIDVVGYMVAGGAGTGPPGPAGPAGPARSGLFFVADYNFTNTTSIGTNNLPPSATGYVADPFLDEGRYSVTGDLTVRNVGAATTTVTCAMYIDGRVQPAPSMQTISAPAPAGSTYGNLAISGTFSIGGILAEYTLVEFRCFATATGLSYYFGNMTIYKIGLAPPPIPTGGI